MGKDSLYIPAKLPIRCTRGFGVGKLCRSARAKGRVTGILLYERQQVVGERLEVHVLHLLKDALRLVEDFPGLRELNLLSPQLS
jgi:hypothetical protein